MSSELVLQPDEAGSADTYLINGPYADLNFGDTQLMTIGTASISKVTVYSRALLRFDVRAVPARAALQSVVLTLFHGDGGSLPTPMAVRAYRATRADWTEFGATWNQFDGAQAWTAPGGDYDTASHDTAMIDTPSDDLLFSSLKDLTADALENRGGYLNLLCVGSEAGTTNHFIALRSASDPTPSLRPRLIITYDPPTPLPIPNFSGGMLQLTGNLGA